MDFAFEETGNHLNLVFYVIYVFMILFDTKTKYDYYATISSKQAKKQLTRKQPQHYLT